MRSNILGMISASVPIGNCPKIASCTCPSTSTPSSFNSFHTRYNPMFNKSPMVDCGTYAIALRNVVASSSLPQNCLRLPNGVVSVPSNCNCFAVSSCHLRMPGNAPCILTKEDGPVPIIVPPSISSWKPPSLSCLCHLSSDDNAITPP